jgi:hypothetical protein
MKLKALATAASLTLAAALLLWPAFYNGQPFFFPDTTAYVRGVDAAVFKLTGVSTAWTKQAEADTGGNVTPDKAVLAGRSIYYGALVYLGDRGGGEWLSVVIQALLLALALYATLSAFDLAPGRYLLVLVAFLALFTLVPLYASFLMPDAFTGIAILACGMLLACDMRGRPAARVGWFVLLTLSLTFHTTHAILALLLLGLGLVLYAIRRPLIMPQGLAAIAVAVGLAFLCGVAFTVGVTRLLGVPPLTPPFLMARLIDDGPGYRYLQDTCPGSGYVVCRFLSKLPFESDDFLWSKDPAKGVFAVSDPPTRRALSQEQYRFAVAVFLHDPLHQLGVSLRNAGEQAGLLQPTEFAYTDEEKATFERKVPPSYLATMQTTPAYRGGLPMIPWSIVSYSSTVLSVFALAVFFLRGRYARVQGSTPLELLTGLVVFGVLANAAICGIMSGPHDRYQARVAWLIPALALIGAFKIYAPWWKRMLGLGAPQ